MFRIHDFMRKFIFGKSKMRDNFGTEPLLLLVLCLEHDAKNKIKIQNYVYICVILTIRKKYLGSDEY